MTTRRQFLLVGAFGAVLTPNGLAQTRTPRIGMLSGLPLDKSAAAPLLLNALAKLGYRDKAGMLLDYRYSHDPNQYPALAKQLIAAKCDVIFALVSEEAARAFRDASGLTPVVFLAFDYDPVEKGIVSSMRRPGGNMTGIYLPDAALTGKRLEIAQEVLPDAKRFLVLADIHTKRQLAALRDAAAVRGAQLTVVEYVKSPYDLAAGFETGRQDRVHALLFLFSPEFLSRRAELSALIASHKLPAIVSGTMADAPAMLVSYSPNQTKIYQRAAELGVQLLKGAKAGEIPVEQPVEYDLIVNLRTARALGLKIPYSVMARATKVIE